MDRELADLLQQFVRVRILRMNEVDLSVFAFDYDLTWMAFCLDANEHIYSRYGGRDASSPEARLSVAGLKDTLRRVLAEHKLRPQDEAPPPRRPVYPRDLFRVKGDCLHCHQVWEGLRRREKDAGRFDPESLYVYPPPENIGLTLDVHAGPKIVRVQPASPAERAGLRAGDVLERVGAVRTLSQADVMWALHNAPAAGRLPLRYLRAGQPQTAVLELNRGWRKTDLSWRTSMRMEKKPK